MTDVASTDLCKVLDEAYQLAVEARVRASMAVSDFAGAT